ncbi:SusD/RagB family nutrient-binding outer membrane lipoprotein [Sinomicrobium oceani]|uniref:SusD/RagB family nutrient-binding outer membrane lipoprotein n=1 Tax=Sinomicrobium oceani TaxID=1150368 RepID=UPI00227B4AC4|nr:SusD/RagB family nutrient-binding outer membrane lipoprotein [Sinomicrobium oceani]
MKKIYRLLIVLTGGLTLLGCSSDYFDVNTPSGAATEDQLRMNDLLGPSIYHTVLAQYWAERSFGNYIQYFTGQTGEALGQTEIASTWSNTFLYALPNLKVIWEKAEDQQAIHFRGVTKVLIAVNLGLATDSYGNIPYTEASMGVENTKPVFDEQELIYTIISDLLDEAIADLQAEDTSDFVPTESDDLIYRGDMDKWLRAAYTLKARYQLHLSEVNGVDAALAALESLENGFTSNADDFQMEYTERTLNPWYSREVLARSTGNDHDKIGDQLVSYMNGNIYAFENSALAIDPRLPVYAENADGEDAEWKGYVSGGQGASSDGTDANTSFAEGGFYSSIASPVVVISYAEALFIKAEAEFLANGGTATSTGASQAAYEAYLEGIAANMDKLEVDGSLYLADGAIAVGQDNLMLHHIMKEKYIANFLNPETYVDFRRYDFSDEVFLALELPLNNVDSEFPGQWLLRAQYPSSEEIRNPENVQLNKQSPIIPVWWDQ